MGLIREWLKLTQILIDSPRMQPCSYTAAQVAAMGTPTRYN